MWFHYSSHGFYIKGTIVVVKWNKKGCLIVQMSYLNRANADMICKMHRPLPTEKDKEV